MKKIISLIVALIINISCGDGITNPSVDTFATNCQITNNGSGNAACGSIVITQPPTASPKPEDEVNCDRTYLRIDGPSVVVAGTPGNFSLTPMQEYKDGLAFKERPTPDVCNAKLANTVIWTVESGPGTIIGDGFAATLRRTGSSTAAITVRVDFANLFSLKVVQ